MILPILLLLLPVPRLAQRSPCVTSSDCRSSHAPHCSKWGWCQWPRELASDLGQCRTNLDCTSRFPVCSNDGYCFDKPKLKVHLPPIVLPANTISQVLQAELRYVNPPPRERQGTRNKKVIHPKATRKNERGSRIRQIEHVIRKQNTGEAPVRHVGDGTTTNQRNNGVQRSHIQNQSSHTSRVVSIRNLLNFNTIVSSETSKKVQNRFSVLSSQRGQNFPPKTSLASTSVKNLRRSTTIRSVLPQLPSRKNTTKPKKRQFTAIPAVPADREIMRRRVLAQKWPASDRLQPTATTPPPTDIFQTASTAIPATPVTRRPVGTQFTAIPAVPNLQNLQYDYSDYPEIDRNSRNNDYDIQEKVGDQQDNYDYYDYGIAGKEILKKQTETVFTNKNNKNRYLVQKLFSHKSQQRSNNKEPEQFQTVDVSHKKIILPQQSLVKHPTRSDEAHQNIRHTQTPKLVFKQNPPTRRRVISQIRQPNDPDPGVSRGCLYDCVYECVAIEQQEAYKACVKFCGDTCD